MDQKTAALALRFLLRMCPIDSEEASDQATVMTALWEIINRPDENRPDLVALRASITAQSDEVA